MTSSALTKRFANDNGYTLTRDGNQIIVAVNDRVVGIRSKYDGALSVMRADLAKNGKFTAGTVVELRAKAELTEAQRKPWAVFANKSGRVVERAANYTDAVKSLRQGLAGPNTDKYWKLGYSFRIIYAPT